MVRRKVIHGRVAAYLPFPPMGKLDDIASVVNEFLDMGFGVRHIAGEISDIDDALIDTEYVYAATETASRTGDAWSNVRYGRNRLSRLLPLRVEGRSFALANLHMLNDLAARWYRQRRGVSGTGRILDQLRSRRDDSWSANVIVQNGIVVALSVTELIGTRQAAIVVRLHDYELAPPGMMGALQWLDLEAWPGCDLTIGSAVGRRTLEDHKLGLGVCYRVPIYCANPRRQMTLEDYHERLQPGVEFGLLAEIAV